MARVHPQHSQCKGMQACPWINSSTNVSQDPEIQEVAPKIMDVICQRLESRYMEMSEFDNTNPVLRRFPVLKRKARDIAHNSRA